MVETLKHKTAFEEYYLLGDHRSYSKVAQKLSVSKTSIKKWAKNFDWIEKVQLRDQNNAKKLEAKTDIKVIDDKAKILGISRRLLDMYVKKLNEQIGAEIESLADLEKVVKINLGVQGDKSMKDIGSLSDTDLEKEI